MNRIEELEKIIAKAQAELEALRVGDNHSRAKKMVDSWPIWKREVSLTKYSTSVPVAASDSHDRARKTTSEQERQNSALKRMIATQQLKDRIAELNAQQGWVVDWSNEQQNKFLPIFVHKSKRVSLDCEHLYAWSPVEFYGSLETIETVIKEMPEQIKLWLGVE